MPSEMLAKEHVTHGEPQKKEARMEMFQQSNPTYTCIFTEYLPTFHVIVTPTLVPKIGGVHGMSLFSHG